MVRVGLVLLMVWLGLATGGCSVARYVGMRGMIEDEAAVMPGGKRESLDVYVLFSQPGNAMARVGSPREGQETLDFYRRRIRGHGWELLGEDADTWEVFDRERPGIYNARRRLGVRVGKDFWSWGEEKLTLSVHPLGEGSEGTNVTIDVTGDYAWDKPGEALETGAGYVVGVAAQGVYVVCGSFMGSSNALIATYVIISPLFVVIMPVYLLL
jgi:hypothetical protein